ncbi:MAG: redoxin domain-containing protein [Bacillus sp. (in: Bacteria)]|nr:redoxin domain-containing protein [Bacillus sp. (in: firmicutes)]
MPEEFKPGCQRPVIKQPTSNPDLVSEDKVKEMNKTMIKVGKPAPDFSAAAFYQGKFVETSLSEYKGKWLLLCFYPGDFTFV